MANINFVRQMTNVCVVNYFGRKTSKSINQCTVAIIAINQHVPDRPDLVLHGLGLHNIV